jgi:hypothetical protein
MLEVRNGPKTRLSALSVELTIAAMMLGAPTTSRRPPAPPATSRAVCRFDKSRVSVTFTCHANCCRACRSFHNKQFNQLRVLCSPSLFAAVALFFPTHASISWWPACLPLTVNVTQADPVWPFRSLRPRGRCGSAPGSGAQPVSPSLPLALLNHPIPYRSPI